MKGCRRQFLRRGLTVGIIYLLSVTSIAEQPKESKRDFKVSAGNAARTLKQAARQGRVDIVFSANIVKGVKTRSIKGEYTPKEALNLMLGGSFLVAVKHQKSGVYLVKRQEASAMESR